MDSKPSDAAVRRRGATVRQRVLDAAEHLLRSSEPDFSMRDLASAAGVSFATPFNQFGSKLAIFQALSERRIETMMTRLRDAPQSATTAERVLQAVAIAAAVMLEEPAVSRAVMGGIGLPGPTPGQVRERSVALWAEALGDAADVSDVARDEMLSLLPGQLAFAFRGVLSFWTAGELDDDALSAEAKAMAIALLRSYGFTAEGERRPLS